MQPGGAAGEATGGDKWLERRVVGGWVARVDREMEDGCCPACHMGAKWRAMILCPTPTPGHLPGSGGRPAGLHMPPWLWG